MQTATLHDLDARGLRVLVRVDFNVPLDGTRVTDDTRINAALPTIRALTAQGGRVILMSHLGRPKGKVVESMRMAPVAERLQDLLGQPVVALDACTGEAVEAAVAGLPDGGVCLLENLRFHAEEEANDPGFAAALARLGDVYINDAFGTAHRAHASTAGVCAHLPSAAGLLMQKEIDFLGRLLEAPEAPFACVLGGAKVADKIAILQNMLERVDRFVIGGGMAFTFLHLQGARIGRSLLDPNPQNAQAFLDEAARRGKKVYLPVDVVAASGLDSTATQVVDAQAIPDELMGLDIGPRTVALFEEALADARTVLWNGPMGVFERPQFAQGTLAVAQALAASSALTVIGGGDSAAAVTQMGLEDKMTHISTGGGASLELLEGKVLPGVAALHSPADFAARLAAARGGTR
jgi:phosphoglycerate kinase